ncbi:hypothetical protein N7499_012419 [Penicillium canescens]|nr:hypothetical protein N7499_012419 [Penicillium canescens]
MSIDTQPQVVSPAPTSTSTSSTAPIPKSGDTSKEKDPDSETQVISPTPTTEQDKEKATEDPKPSAYNPTTLLTTLLSPFTFSSTPSSSSSLSPAPPPPEPYYTPAETPLFKTLQRRRLTRTREKQLLRAAERDYNDPPPPPGLGDCCGSSCDPCVRDLWGEEIGVWRGRWGGSGC